MSGTMRPPGGGPPSTGHAGPPAPSTAQPASPYGSQGPIVVGATTNAPLHPTSLALGGEPPVSVRAAGAEAYGAPVVRAQTAMTRVGDDALGSPSPRASLAELPLKCPACGTRYPAEFNVCPRDATELVGAAGEQVVDDLVGQVIRDTYKIVRIVGEGGMGRVYEARHVRIRNKRFAIKTLHPEFARHDEVLARFHREAEAAATIRSPNVMQVYDVDDTAEGRPFMVGEFLEGRELGDHLAALGKLPVGPAVNIVRQVCAGLRAAHELGIVHRDMKPENVFLTGDLDAPVAKVIDFGISKANDAVGASLTRTGMIMGTPAFMAPEQARGERVTHLVDVYATGAILYTLLTGRRPYDKPDAAATLTAVLLEEPARPRALEPSIPEGLEMVLQRAMAKNPADRHPTIDALDRELASYDVAPIARPQGPGQAPVAGATGPTRDARDLEASAARPTLALLGTLGTLFVLGGLLTLISGVLRLSRGGIEASMTGTEAIATIGMLLVALSAPGFLAVRHVRDSAWSNTARVIELVRRVRWPVLAGVAAYGTGSLFVRIVETVLLRRALGAAWPVWDVLMVLFAAAATAAAVAVTRGRS